MRSLRVVGLLAALASMAGPSGCASDDDDTPGSAASAGTGGSTGNGGTGGTSGSSGDAGEENAGAAGASDTAPYANVVAVTATGSDGAYTFSVSIESADIDCTQFANWWEVLTEEGALTYRRILEHSHTDANGSSDADAPGNTFTRSGGPVPVDADTVVVVRAHMSTGGYNGAVMRGSVTAGFTQATEIDGDFAPDVESASPQPTGCDF